MASTELPHVHTFVKKRTERSRSRTKTSSPQIHNVHTAVRSSYDSVTNSIAHDNRETKRNRANGRMAGDSRTSQPQHGSDRFNVFQQVRNYGSRFGEGLP
ncbi:unnamed protein product [Ectocarpus sp. 12 AP-2014]